MDSTTAETQLDNLTAGLKVQINVFKMMRAKAEGFFKANHITDIKNLDREYEILLSEITRLQDEGKTPEETIALVQELVSAQAENSSLSIPRRNNYARIAEMFPHFLTGEASLGY